MQPIWMPFFLQDVEENIYNSDYVIIRTVAGLTVQISLYKTNFKYNSSPIIIKANICSCSNILFYFNEENKTWGNMQSSYVVVESTTSIWNNNIQLRKAVLDFVQSNKWGKVKKKKQMWNALITLEMVSLQNNNNYKKNLRNVLGYSRLKEEIKQEY